MNTDLFLVVLLYYTYTHDMSFVYILLFNLTTCMYNIYYTGVHWTIQFVSIFILLKCYTYAKFESGIAMRNFRD